MMQEYLKTSPQRQEAFNWLYQLISPKYIAMVEQNFEPDSDMIAPFKAYIAYRVAVESALLFNDPNEYHFNTYHDIKNQLTSDVTTVIRRSQNPWLKKCFQEGLRFQPGSVEFELRQQIFLDMQKDCAFLRDHILGPELDQLKPSVNLSWSIWQMQPWMWVALVGVFLFFGAFINVGLATVLLNKEVLMGIGTALLIGVVAQWLIKAVPSFLRSVQLKWHYGQWLGITERNHLSNLHPEKLIGDNSSWMSYFNGSKKSGVNETWVDLDQWMAQNLSLYTFAKPQNDTKVQATPGRPTSWGMMQFFSSDNVRSDVQEATVETRPSVADQDINYNLPGRYAPGS